MTDGGLWTDARARLALRSLLSAALQSADPRAAVLRHLPERPVGRCVVVGAGKASAVMACALNDAWPDVALTGVVVTRDGHAISAGRIEVQEAAHPVPDARSERAARRILQAVQGLTPDDLVIALISGGGSALMAAPAGDLTLSDKQDVNRALLRSGATIHEMNMVRKFLSAIKGGRLAQAAHPARVVSLVISDVPGDDPADIASGPTIPMTGSVTDVLDIIARYELQLPPRVQAFLQEAAQAPVSRPTSAASREVRTALSSEVRVVATPRLALEAAAREARRFGLTPLILGDALQGESRELGTFMAGLARSVRQHGDPVKPPAVLLSGGETTVTLRGPERGRGGRNTEFLLSLAVNLTGEDGIWALAADTDGIDGTEDAAGAFITPDSLARGRHLGRDARRDLGVHDSYGYFQALDDLIVTGPTLTNVNDLRAVLITH